jgi:hypothetical protein
VAASRAWSDPHRFRTARARRPWPPRRRRRRASASRSACPSRPRRRPRPPLRVHDADHDAVRDRAAGTSAPAAELRAIPLGAGGHVDADEQPFVRPRVQDAVGQGRRALAGTDGDGVEDAPARAVDEEEAAVGGGTITRSAVRTGEATTGPAATRQRGRIRAAGVAGRAPVRAASPRNSGQAGAAAPALVRRQLSPPPPRSRSDRCVGSGKGGQRTARRRTVETSAAGGPSEPPGRIGGRPSASADSRQPELEQVLDVSPAALPRQPRSAVRPSGI